MKCFGLNYIIRMYSSDAFSFNLPTVYTELKKGN